MKSKLLSLTDYRSVKIDTPVVLKDPSAYAERMLHRLVRAGKTMQETAAVCPGDVVTLDLVFDDPCKNRTGLPVTVGSGLYDEEAEQQMLGKCVLVPFRGTFPGGNAVCTITKILHAQYPQPTDAMVRAYAEGKAELEGIETVDAYLQHFREESLQMQKNDARNEAMQHLYESVLSTSDFFYDPDEVEAMIRSNEENVKQQFNGKTLEDLTPDELGAIGVSSVEEMREMLRSGAEEFISGLLWTASLQGTDPAGMDPFDKDVYPDWDFLRSYVDGVLQFQEGGANL